MDIMDILYIFDTHARPGVLDILDIQDTYGVSRILLIYLTLEGSEVICVCYGYPGYPICHVGDIQDVQDILDTYPVPCVYVRISTGVLDIKCILCNQRLCHKYTAYTLDIPDMHWIPVTHLQDTCPLVS